MNTIQRFWIPIVCSLLAVNAFVWHAIWKGLPNTTASFHFLDVGQGDSGLLLLPGNVAILTDAGPDRKVVEEITQILPPSRRYIDIGIITHPQLDHYGGYLDLLRHYRFGAFLLNGRDAVKGRGNWTALLEKIERERIPKIVMGEGSRLRYKDSLIDFLSPNGKFLKSKELNNTGLVEYVRTPFFSALLTADIGTAVEQFLIKKMQTLKADILKVGHHGSKFSTSNTFLDAVNPKVALIGVGKNSYGHPTKEVLTRLASSSAPIVLRTDERGTITIEPEAGKLRIYTER